jgi:hypothetical protein
MTTYDLLFMCLYFGLTGQALSLHNLIIPLCVKNPVMGVSCVYISVHSPSAVSTVTLLEDWWPAKSGQYLGGGIPISAHNHPPVCQKSCHGRFIILDILSEKNVESGVLISLPAFLRCFFHIHSKVHIHPRVE